MGELSLPGLNPGKSVLITGAAGGIGRALVAAFGSFGMAVGALGRDATSLADSVAGLPSDRTLVLAADVADAPAMDEAVGEFVARFGALDILVHAAAVSEGSVPVVELTDEQIDGVVRTNVRGSLVTSRAAAREMVPRRQGRIVNIASVAAHQAMPGRSTYGTTKAALVQLTRQLAVELGPMGITANSISPGQTPTEITLIGDAPGLAPRPKGSAPGEAGADRIPLRRRGRIEDYVGPVLFLASDLAGYITGADIPVSGGSMILRS